MITFRAHEKIVREVRQELEAENARLKERIKRVEEEDGLHIEALRKKNAHLRERIAKLEAALFCRGCGGTGKKEPYFSDLFTPTGEHYVTLMRPSCPTCGWLREPLKEQEKCR